MIVLESPLSKLDGVGHAFFTRSGGVSTGIYRSLNCSHGSNDKREAIVENRRRAMARLDLSSNALITCRQVHGTTIMNINTERAPVGNIEADGLVTNQRGIALGVLTADCAPIILADVNAGVIGSIHAGWRGALAGIVEAGVKAMVGLGARVESINTSIGPCIGANSYEVESGFACRFVKKSRDAEIFFKPALRPGHHFFDLSGYAEMRLAACGLRGIHRCPEDTYLDADQFFSFRRSQHNGEIDYGRALTAIVLR